MFHSGGIEVFWQHAQPMYIASAAEKFPGVPMIMARVGCESWQQAMWVARCLHNVYLDLSIHWWEYVMYPKRFYAWLREIVGEVTPWKVMWASDGPYPNEMVRLPEWVKAIKDALNDLFTAEEKDIMLRKAAARVFDIS